MGYNKYMNIKAFIQDPRVKNLPGNQFKFLLDLYALSNKDGVVENFTILDFAQRAKKEKNGNSTSRNSLAKYLQEFQDLKLLNHDRYKKTIKFEE